MPGAGNNLRRIARSARSASREIIEDSARTVATAVERALAGDTGGDKILSRAPAKLSVKKKIDGHGDLVTAKISPGPGGRAVAQHYWLTQGTKAHKIGARTHPGSKGKGTWNAATRALDSLPAQIRRRFDQILRS